MRESSIGLPPKLWKNIAKVELGHFEALYDEPILEGVRGNAA